jgi:1-acyl-sn-glycerol-3-phosphate acyltransferase
MHEAEQERRRKILERIGYAVAMIGMDDILEKHYPKIRATRVTVIFGEPIPTADLTRDEKVALPGVVRERIVEMLKAHGVSCPEETQA